MRTFLVDVVLLVSFAISASAQSTASLRIDLSAAAPVTPQEIPASTDAPYTPSQSRLFGLVLFSAAFSLEEFLQASSMEQELITLRREADWLQRRGLNDDFVLYRMNNLRSDMNTRFNFGFAAAAVAIISSYVLLYDVRMVPTSDGMQVRIPVR